MRTFKELLESRKPELDIVSEAVGGVAMPMYKKHITPHTGKNYLQIAIQAHKSGNLDDVIKDLTDERKAIVAKQGSFKAAMLHDHAIKGLTAAKKNLPDTEKKGPELDSPQKLKEDQELVDEFVENYLDAVLEANPLEDEVGGYKKNKPVQKAGDEKQGKKMGKKSIRNLRAAKQQTRDYTCESVEQIEELMDVGQAHRTGAIQRAFDTHLATSKKEAPSAPEHEHHAKALNNAVRQTVGAQHVNKFRVTDAARVIPRGSLGESIEEDIISETWYHPQQVGEIGDGDTKVKIFRGKGGAIVTKHYVKGKLVTMQHQHGHSRIVREAIELTEDDYEGVEGHPAFKKKDEVKSRKGTYGTSHTAGDDDEHEIGINTQGKKYTNALGDALGGKAPKVPDEKKMKQLQAAGKARIVRHDENLDIVLVKNGVVYEFAIVEGDNVIGEGRAVTEQGALAQAERLIETTGKKMPSEVGVKKIVNIAKKVVKYKQ